MPFETKVKKGRDGENTYSGEWRNIIVNAHHTATCFIESMNDDILEIYNQPGTGSARRQARSDAWQENGWFVKWLGSDAVTNEEIVDVKRRIGKIKKRWEKGILYVVIQEQTGNRSYGCKGEDGMTNAYVTGPIHGEKIHLCPRWFSDEYSMDQKAGILVHEVVHKLGLFGKSHHGAVSQGEALKLAREHPRSARKSPENYEQLCLEYVREC